MINISVSNALRVIQFGDLKTSYVQMGSNFSYPNNSFQFVNTTDSLVYISLNASVDHIAVPPDSIIPYEGSFVQSSVLFAKYVGTAPTKGAIFANSTHIKGF